MKIKIKIDFSQEQEFSCLLDPIIDNILILSFNSFKQYSNFIKSSPNFDISPQNFIDLDEDEEKEKFLMFKNFLDNNSQKFINLLKKKTIDVININCNNITDELPNQNMIVNLEHLNPEEIITILTKIPWNKDTIFIDKYNTYHAVTKDELLKTYQNIFNMIKKIKELMMCTPFSRQEIKNQFIKKRKLLFSFCVSFSLLFCF